MSNLFHTAFILLCMTVLAVAHVPISALAGITAWMGFCLLEWSTWSRLRTDAVAFLLTATSVLVVNAAIAVAIGWGVYAVRAMVQRVLSAWLVTAYRFPGQRVLEWALVLPLAMPAYVMAYAYTDWLQFTGPVQTALRAATGWQAREYWFPEIRSLGGAALLLSFVLYPYVYSSRAPHFSMSRAARWRPAASPDFPPGAVSGAWRCRSPARRSPPALRSR